LVFYFTHNHYETEIKSFQPLRRVLKLFQKHFSDIEHVGKYSDVDEG